MDLIRAPHRAWYILKRGLVALFVVLTVSMLVFAVTNTAMDPAQAIVGADALPSDVAAARIAYGLDKPLPLRFTRWLGNAAVGEFGYSYSRRDLPVSRMILDGLPVTATLAIASLLLALALAVPLGVLAALRPNSLLDRIALAIAVVGQALPSFWFALILIAIFGVFLRWLPVSGATNWTGYILPSVTLAYYSAPAFMRLVRAAMIDVLQADYIRTARAKGLRETSVLFKHALRNAILPLVSLTAVQLGFLLGGSVVIESVFALHGIGFLAWQSIGRGDLPVVQAIVVLIACAYAALSLLADLAAARLDPRVTLR